MPPADDAEPAAPPSRLRGRDGSPARGPEPRRVAPSAADASADEPADDQRADAAGSDDLGSDDPGSDDPGSDDLGDASGDTGSDPTIRIVPAKPRSRPVEVEPTRWYRRRVTLVAGGVVLLLGAGLVWVLVTGLLARSHLEQARSEASALQSALTGGAADQADVDARVQRIAAQAHRAHQLTTGPAWAVSAAVPWLGRPAAVVRGITASTDQLGRAALPALGRVADQVAGGGLRQGGRIDLTALDRLSPDVGTATRGLETAGRRLARLPGSTWLGPVDRARSEVAGQIGTLTGTFSSADTALRVLPTMLGATTPQRYFVAFQNNAEARGTGGLPGAFGIVTAVRGTVEFERFESDYTLVQPLVDVDGEVDFGREQADFLAQYGYDLPFGDYRESNESPNFPYAARIWAAMWQKYSGEEVTGAIALDPTALSYLLQATGPVKLADGSLLAADDIVALTQKDVYAKFPGLDRAAQDARKDYLLDVASRAEKALLGAGADTATLVRGATRAAGERRLLVWSADPAVESQLAGSAIGGVLPETTQPFGLLTVLNVSGTKLDYYLDRRVTWTRSGCGDTRDVTVRITVTNLAPPSGLPAYVTVRADDPPAGTPVGSNRWVLDWFGTSGGLLQSVTVDGQPATARVYEQRGHPVFRTLVETPPGGSHTVLLHLREPAGSAPVTLLAQPLVRPLDQDAVDDSC